MKTKTLSILSALALPLLAGSAHAEITQDCILEGSVDKRKAAQLGRDVYVKFRSAEAGDAAPCDMSRSSRSRRVQFKAPSTDDITDAPHGAAVKYRYIERDNGHGQWQLMEPSDGAI
ncbi:hypothetical protein [Pseudohaliea rubra]|uniref:Uncharacterized protein n=1 Tax=Pseudohaliea rubra DSM 19751 TaxID=1265313 RepID=A0A095WVV0_9GAMM|nr:hypothetical protein [Pseudohaliea rubra]KGE02774.1 hypothetical protein HRUBRA_02752 [Pseudohaliea rubra DSM 19751]